MGDDFKTALKTGGFNVDVKKNLVFYPQHIASLLPLMF